MEKSSKSVLSFVNRDAEEVAEFFGRRYSPPRIEPHRLDGIINMRGVYGRLPGIDFNTTEFKIGFDILPQHTESSFFFMFPSSGAIRLGLGGLPIEANIEVATASYGDTIEKIRFCSGLRNSTLSIRRDLIIDRLSVLLDRPVSFPINFEPVADRRSPKMQGLEAAIAFLSKSAFGLMIEETPIASTQMSNAIADLLLEVWPHSFSDSLRRPFATAAPRHVRRAIEYMNEDLSSEITVEELAKISGVSLRALQYGFRQFVGMTIVQYHRQLRLEGSRRTLMSDPSLSLKDIARIWRFSNVDRFSSEFERAFGETPFRMKQRICKV